MTQLQAEQIAITFLEPRYDAAKRMQHLARIGRLYLDTHYCPAPLTAAEVQAREEKRLELDRACREIGGGK